MSKRKTPRPNSKFDVQNEYNDDFFDDRMLIKAYELAIKMQNADLAKSIAADTNKKTASVQPLTTDTEDDERSSYNVGDYVRATYDVDGIDYEAQIIEIDEENGDCVVKFIGYDNEQKVLLTDLVDSWGKEQQKKQELEAAAEVNEANDETGDNSYPREIYRNYDMSKSSLPTPPIPPMPPMLREAIGEQDSEHFSAMLMSWYMSGYYTGLYQGHKLAKQQQNKKSLKRK